jgi:hypothetical protein
MIVYLLFNKMGELMGVYSTREKANEQISPSRSGWYVYPESVK